jgi:hypothetical protein
MFIVHHPCNVRRSSQALDFHHKGGSEQGLNWLQAFATKNKSERPHLLAKTLEISAVSRFPLDRTKPSRINHFHPFLWPPRISIRVQLGRYGESIRPSFL